MHSLLSAVAVQTHTEARAEHRSSAWHNVSSWGRRSPLKAASLIREAGAHRTRFHLSTFRSGVEGPEISRGRKMSNPTTMRTRYEGTCEKSRTRIGSTSVHTAQCSLPLPRKAIVLLSSQSFNCRRRVLACIHGAGHCEWSLHVRFAVYVTRRSTNDIVHNKVRVIPSPPFIPARPSCTSNLYLQVFFSGDGANAAPIFRSVRLGSGSSALPIANS